MRVAIAGGTGTLGSRVAGQLREHGHDVRVLSRNAPEYRVDLTTGEGLSHALEGCDVVVDATNNSSRHAARTLVAGTGRMLAAEQAAGVRHHVGVSIVGCERVPLDIDVAGPEVTDARVLARTWRSVTGRSALLLPLPMPGRLGRALRSGALTAERPDVRGTTGFAAWLAAAQA